MLPAVLIFPSDLRDPLSLSLWESKHKKEDSQGHTHTHTKMAALFHI